MANSKARTDSLAVPIAKHDNTINVYTKVHHPITLGTFIRERRKQLGLTQEQLAERVADGVRQSEISRLEHDRVTLPRRDRLEQLAAALDVSIGELLLRTGWMNEGDQLAVELQAAPDTFPDRDGVDAIALQNLTTLVDTVFAVQEMVAEASIKLEQAEQSINSLMTSLNLQRPPAGGVRVKAGLMDAWETSAIVA